MTALKMPEDYLRDPTSKIHGIRDGEPKRPESLIEMPSMVPEVPEVSLCFTGNEEMHQTPRTNKASPYEVVGNFVDNHQRHNENEKLHRTKFESYNTWKAKNAELLHNITGGLERVEFGSKRPISTKRPGGIVRKQNCSIGAPLMNAQKTVGNEDVQILNPTQQNGYCAEYSPQISGQILSSASNQPSNTYPVEHARNVPHMYQFPHNHGKPSQQNENMYKNPTPPSPNLPNHYTCKDKTVQNAPYHQLRDRSNPHDTSGFCVPNYCNKPQCSCEKQNGFANAPIGNQYAHENFTLTNDIRNNIRFPETTNHRQPTDSGLINSHFFNLSQLINIQKDQISMLYQEIISQKTIMTVLLEEVKQIRATISLNQQVHREMLTSGNKSCKCCTCEEKNDMGVRNKNNGSTAKQPQTSPKKVEMKTIGVMTSSLDNSTNSKIPSNEKETSKEAKDKVHKGKHQSVGPKPIKSSPPNKNKKAGKKVSRCVEEKRKSQSNHTQTYVRKNQKAESNESSQSEDSFSLDEAAVVVRDDAEQADVSPEVSIHVNMPDYSSSSAESNSSDSFDSEDEGQESGTGGESSDPQIGWTFYDRVVGQVNNMLKKTSNDGRQEYTHQRKKNVGNDFYQCNEDYETENNWSKRVTFDGPPLEDSDNNGFHMPRYQHLRTNQEYRVPGGQERIQDVLLCDYANAGNNLSLVNGSTNLSFATYRYYQRHQLLPPPPPLDPHPNVKRNKSKKKDKTVPVPQKSDRKRSGGPPSKILDMSALKHQPKLF